MMDDNDTCPDGSWAGPIGPDAAAQLAEKEREIARLRFKLYHYAPFSGLAHTTACSIWREDGQGHAEGFEGDRGPCNCGCLENFQRARSEAAEQRLQEAQAEIARLQASAFLAWDRAQYAAYTGENAMTLRRDFEDAIAQQNTWPRDWWPMGAHWNAEVWPQYHFYAGGNCVSCNMYWAVGLACPHHGDAGRE